MHRSGVNTYFTESQNRLGWERPLRSSSPTSDWSPSCQLDHGTECHIQAFLEQFSLIKSSRDNKKLNFSLYCCCSCCLLNGSCYTTLVVWTDSKIKLSILILCSKQNLNIVLITKCFILILVKLFCRVLKIYFKAWVLQCLFKQNSGTLVC